MKRILVFFILLTSGVSGVNAQDIITLRSGEEVKSKIIRLNQKDVTFVAENSSDTVFLYRDDISKLTYRSGIIIYLDQTEMPTFTGGQASDSLFVLGQADAALYYKGYRPAAIGTMFASIYFPFGLIPAIACSSKPPAMHNLGYKDQELMKNANYYDGYTRKAHEIKKKKVWGGFAIGTGFIIGMVFIMSVVATTY